MKQILLSAATMLMVSLNAQVGINTTEPEATLDVNGNVRVQNLQPNNSAEKVLTVDAKNIITATPIHAFVGGSGVANGMMSVKVGKTYTCNFKNAEVTIYMTQGSMTCALGGARNGYKWTYSGAVSNGAFVAITWGYEYNVNRQTLTEFKSGHAVSVKSKDSLNNNEWLSTAPLHVIDDSQYKD